jgi:Kef-type K+ transport system membrane component KefB
VLGAALVSHAFANVFFAMAVVVVVARVSGSLFHRLRQPAVVGEIIAGLVLGKSVLAALPGHLTGRLFPDPVKANLNMLAQLGVVLFMFIVGLEVDLALIRGRARLAVSVSLTSIAVPFGLGVAAAAYLHHAYRRVVVNPGVPHPRVVDVHVLPFVLFIGAAMSITAFPVLARILAERGMQRTELGTLALACAAVDDLAAWSLLALVISVVEAKNALDLPRTLAEALAFVAVLVLLVRPLFARLIDRSRVSATISLDLLASILVGLLVSAFVADHIGIHTIFGAFAFGACIPKRGHEATIAAVVERVESVTVVLLLPLFFVVAGLDADVRAIGARGARDLVLVLVVAIGGKFLGAAGASRAQGLSNRRAMAVGTLMNTRGLTELIILNVGLNLHVLNTEMYTIMVVMAVVTTVMTEPVLRLVYPDRLLDADLADAERAMGETPTYQVLVLLDDGAPGPLVDVAADLAGEGGAVVLTRLLLRRRDAIYADLGGELVQMAATVDELSRLGRHRHDVSVRPLAQFTFEPLEALLAQAERSGADVVMIGSSAAAGGQLAAALLARAPCHVVVAGPGAMADDGTVLVRVASGADAETALELGLRIQMSRARRSRAVAGPVPLRLVPESPDDRRRARRLADRVRGLALAGVTAEAEPAAAPSPRPAGVGALELAGLRRGGAKSAAASLSEAVLDPAGFGLLVRSGDDPERIGIDQHLARLVPAGAPSPGDGDRPTGGAKPEAPEAAPAPGRPAAVEDPS